MKVKIRAAVVVGVNGDWSVVGWRLCSDDFAIGSAHDGVDSEAAFRGFLEAEIDIPDELPTIQAEVKEVRE